MSKDSFGLYVVAKEPSRAKSRLAAQLRERTDHQHPQLARTLATAFADAALADVLVNLTQGTSNARRVLLYAPPDDDARQAFVSILRRLSLSDHWDLEPVASATDSSASSSDLTHVLSGAVNHCRIVLRCKALVLVGMDWPEISVELVERLANAAIGGRARISAATDGGYVALALPASERTEAEAFRDVLWSSHKTCESQMRALEQAGIECELDAVVGDDVDTLSDLHRLQERIRGSSNASVASCNHVRAMLSEHSETVGSDFASLY